MPLFSRRVSLYVSLPVIVGCGAVGYVASTWQSGPIPHPPARSNHTAVVANTTPNEPQLAPPSRTFQTVALPIEEIDLPTPALPATKVAEPLKTNPDDNVRSAPAFDPVIKAAPHASRPDRPVRSTSKARPQRTAQQRTGPPTSPPSGLKSIPIIGPVFSLLQ
jgi:hypothetical protein